MNNFNQRGHVMTIIAAASIASGQVVRMGNVIGVAAHKAASGEQLELNLQGVYAVPKVSGAVIAQGESLVWDQSAGSFDDNLATPAAGDLAGAGAFAFEAAGNGVTTMLVRFTGTPGTLT